MKDFKQKINYYQDYTDEFIKLKNQNIRLKKSFKWKHNNFLYIIFSDIIYFLFMIFGLIYCKLILRVKFINKEIINSNKGFYIFANHTQMIGDAFIPALAIYPKKTKVVVNPANLGIPILGKFLPMLGALPIPNDIHKKMQLFDAMKYYISKKQCVVIYPEGHLWPWCTEIRPFEKTAFRFPASENVPSFCLTITYQKRKFFKKPKITIYCDGPYYCDNSLTEKENAKKLQEQIYNKMLERSKNNTFEYIKYQKKD